MKLGLIGSILLFTITPALTWAQTADEQLLAAQMQYQKVNRVQQAADERLNQAQQVKSQAEQRLAEAQAALDSANAELSTAGAAQAQAARDTQIATQVLNEAWRRKEAK